MKGKRLVNISLITLLALSMIMVLGPITTRAAISPNSPADAVYLVPDQNIFSSGTYCTYNNTEFTVTVIFDNVTGIAGFQIVIDYNSTLLQNSTWTFDTGTPMTSSQVAPAPAGRLDTDKTVAGKIQLATVWTTASPWSFTGNATAAEINFKIIYCPPQNIFPAPDVTVSCILDNDPTGTKAVDTSGDDIFFTYVGDSYYEYTTLAKIPGAPEASFVYNPPFPNPSDIVTVTSTSVANGVGDYITGYVWEVSGPATVIDDSPIYGSWVYDYYMVMGHGIDPVEPIPNPDPAGFGLSFYSQMYNGTLAPAAAPVYNFGNVTTAWSSHSQYLRQGYSPRAGLMGARVEITNNLGVPVIIDDLTAQTTATTDGRHHLYSYNYSAAGVDTLDPTTDECDYYTGEVVVGAMPDMEGGQLTDRSYMKWRDPLSSAYPLYPLSLVEADANGDAAATGHVAPIAFPAGTTFTEYFGPIMYTCDTQLPWGEQANGTITLNMTYHTQGPTLTFHCDGPGYVNVTLTVYDDEGLKDSVIVLIEQTEAPAAEVDLWTSGNRFCGQRTDHVGKGFGAPADAISPDVNVTYYALVTWGGAPLAHRLVGFEIVDPEGNNVVTMTAETDKQGVARIWWRMPFMNPPDQIFGVWNATVSVKIQDTKVYDYMEFKVGWVITITGLWLNSTELDIGNPDGSAVDGDVIEVTVELKNIMMMPKEWYLAVTILDDCDVPILKLQDSGVSEAEFPWCTPAVWNVTLTGQIPHWAYVGTGKVIASVYTLPPFDCGTPYSPPESTVFQLIWTGTLFDDP
jgi:hypothetical protein